VEGLVKQYTKNPVGAHYGTNGFLIQRFTAVIMAVYTLALLLCVLVDAPHSYTDWKAIFGGTFMRLATMLFFGALLYHAWIGMRDIFMDYVKPMGLRLALQFAVVVVLLLYLVWAASILWAR
jgi:succinate dehydrogenase / fumarate reductase membrane anchor subunit